MPSNALIPKLLQINLIPMLMMMAVCMQAATYTWDGHGGSNPNTTWSFAQNWNPNTAPGRTDGHDLVFATGNKLSNEATGGDWTIGSLTFNSTAGSFTLGGGVLNIGSGGVTNNSANSQTINNQITLSATQTWNASGGALVFNGYVGGGGQALTLDGSQAITVNNQLNGLGTLANTGSGDRTYGGYTSATTFNAGGTGTSNYNAQVNVTTVNVTSGTHLFNDTVNVTTLNINGGSTSLTGSASKNIAGTVVNGGTLIMAQTGGGDAINGTLVVNDGGTVVFQGDNQIPAWTTVTLNEDSTLDLGNTEQTFAQLIINGDSVIDFGDSGSQLNVTYGGISIANGITITIVNWDASNGDLFAGSNPGDPVVNIQYADNEGNIYATGTWGGGVITPGGPVPEPSTYGLLLLGGGAAFVALRRRRT